MKIRRYSFLMVALMLVATTAQAQNDVMMQAFYWDVPVDTTNKDGSWWDSLAVKAVACVEHALRQHFTCGALTD